MTPIETLANLLHQTPQASPEGHTAPDVGYECLFPHSVVNGVVCLYWFDWWGDDGQWV